jgi:hypothetical protein
VAYPILEQTGELAASRLKTTESDAPAYRPRGEPAARPG